MDLFFQFPASNAEPINLNFDENTDHLNIKISAECSVLPACWNLTRKLDGF